MKKTYSQHHFTLVELLVVVGVVAILAGLVLPAVIGGIQQGRITQAKSDLASIMMALKGVEGTYGKMVKKDSTENKYIFGKNATKYKLDANSDNLIVLGGDTATEAYYGLIAILTGMKKGVDTWNINARKIKFLEPKPNFDPAENFDDAKNTPHLWLDPWGKPYKIYINVTGADEIKVTSKKTVSAKAAGYSFGPNGTDNEGCNVDLNTCITASDTANHKLHDDITTWN